MSTNVRKKVKLAFIVNDAARKISYEKRKKSLLKKLAELTTLCGTEACAIVDSEFETRPEVWPSPPEFLRLVTKYRNVPELVQNRIKLSQESFLIERIRKTKKQLAKMKKITKEKKMSSLILQSLNQPNVMFNLNMVDLHEMIWLINNKLEKVNLRRSALDNMDSTSTTQVAAPTVALVDVENRHEEEAQVAMENEAWFMNLINNDGGIEMVPFEAINNQN